MKFKRINRRNNKDVILEITPLIDVVFLLLIFFMVSTRFIDLDTGINIKLPESAIEEVTENREIIISVTKNNDVYINKTKTNLEEFEKNLEDKLKKANKRNVIIKGDKNTDYGYIVKIMTMCKNAGADELDIATETEK